MIHVSAGRETILRRGSAQRPLALGALLTLTTCLTLPALLSAQRVAEETGAGRAARQQAVRSARDAYLAAARANPPRALPIGVFDSGTGGLAVLEEILRLDQFDNTNGQPRASGDGQPDFEAEQFVFLADQANMPYGNYPGAGRRAVLVELALQDSFFLLGTEYSATPQATRVSRDKSSVKAIVIACNTATAYGRADIEHMLREAGIDVPVISVIQAGAEAAVDSFASVGAGAIGVLATSGTVASGGYPEAIRAVVLRRRHPPICVVQHGSVGLAGAIDGLPEFVLPQSADARPRREYLGPSLGHAQAPIDPQLLPRYGFDFSQWRMLWEGTAEQPTVLQINSVDNYVAYETVSLLEKLRARPDAKPLAVVVLGCTHFPYFTQAFRAKLRQLYDYRENGRYVYRSLIAPDVQFIDPAIHVARRLFAVLAVGAKLRVATDAQLQATRGEFYLTVPNRDYPGVQLTQTGSFTTEYKYGRTRALGIADVRTVPLTPQLLAPDTAARLERQLPAVWKLLQEFHVHRQSTR